ncbi:MAG: heterodisulfide reductase-related iron-sulfur binding cluster [Rhodospirillaceae bacterium]|nr:heterodisulfide reductase-related iron-sulfur binding cluster [Rhodospirillaceae bacterium]
MREGSLEAPTRHPIPWKEDDFLDEQKLDIELRRAFDICHGCRRCFNLCDSFPRLFDLVDESDTGELDSVDSKNFKPIIDACTLCDMCFLTKCPYVPPHEFNLDFPHLMLRARALQLKNGTNDKHAARLTEMDKNGPLATSISGLANWASRRGNSLTRPLMQAVGAIHHDAELPQFSAKTCQKKAAESTPEINRDAPAFGRKAVIYASCFGEYNAPEIVLATRGVLAKNGVETEIVYPECCGMPQLEQGDIARVSTKAKTISATMKPWIEKGYDVVVPVASCSLMLKFEWPLIEPEDENVKLLSGAVYDATEYVVAMAKKEGLASGLGPVEGGVTAHISCHSRAQNMGRKAEELLKLIPGTNTTVIERCSGHGGSWGVMKENFEVGMKIGSAVFRDAAKAGNKYVVSECPLARDQIAQGLERKDAPMDSRAKALRHPIQVLALAYGL